MGLGCLGGLGMAWSTLDIALRLSRKTRRQTGGLSLRYSHQLIDYHLPTSREFLAAEELPSCQESRRKGGSAKGAAKLARHKFRIGGNA